MRPESRRARATAKFADLRPRILSGLALAAVAVAAIAAGGPWSAALVAVAGAAMGWEYRRITLGPEIGPGLTFTLPLGVVVAVAVAHLVSLQAALIWLAVAAALIALNDRRLGRSAVWGAPGLIAIGAASAAFAALRDIPGHGLPTVIWIGLVTVGADVGGYFAGRVIGGPKLWPRVSPAKTWAGLGGAVALAFVLGAIFSRATTGTYVEEVGLVSAAAALVAQGGDLTESALKRRFAVKDASQLIPGHGGALDRLDGFAAATLVAAAVTFARDEAVFIW